MEGFAYSAPQSVEEAVAVLAEARRSGRRAQPLAGGTDMLVQMRTVDRGERLIVDLKRIPEATRLDIGRTTVTIGAAVPAAVLTRHAELEKLFPGLVEAVDLIGSTQIQGRATLGGNLCNSSPAGDTIPALFANAAQCVIRGPGGERRVAVEQFVTGVGDNVLADDEILVALEFARPGPRTSDAYLRFIPRTEMDIAVAGAGVSLTLDAGGTCTAARVAIGAVAPTALLVPAAAAALVGSRVDAAAIARAGDACSAAARPISDKRGTADFRRKVVGVLCRRATAIALSRASGG
jgi:carbon-monoxide dehydrogenase medium subunit